MWPEPTALGEKPSMPAKRMARLVLLQPSSLTTRQQTLPIACSTVPGWLLSWPRLFRDSEPTPSGVRPRRELPLDMANALRSCQVGQWWWPKEEGALGQAHHTGLMSTTLGKRLDDYMAPRERAHFGSVMYWQRGVLLASILHCRETVASEIKNLWLPAVSTELGDRLYQHARDRPNNAPTVVDHHGWQGAPQKQVNLGSVTDPINGRRGPIYTPQVARWSSTCHTSTTPRPFSHILYRLPE
jgi:hypothetical protein